MDEYPFAGRQPPDLTQRVPRGEICDAERRRLAIRQRVRDRDDEVGKCCQVRAERARAESDDALADLHRVDIVAEGGDVTDALAADDRRVAVHARVHTHRLEHVAEVEPGGDDTDLDLVALRRHALHRVHRQRVQPAGFDRPAAGSRHCHRG